MFDIKDYKIFQLRSLQIQAHLVISKGYEKKIKLEYYKVIKKTKYDCKSEDWFKKMILNGISLAA
jgi:hypothetical protein